MGLTCYIIDDELHNIATIKEYIIDANDFKIAGTATDPRIAIEEINKLKPDVVFSDINMPLISGIDLAKQVENITMVVFVTAERLYNLKGIDLDKSIVLHKPLSRAKFLRASELIKSRLI